MHAIIHSNEVVVTIICSVYILIISRHAYFSTLLINFRNQWIRKENYQHTKIFCYITIMPTSIWFLTNAHRIFDYTFCRKNGLHTMQFNQWMPPEQMDYIVDMGNVYPRLLDNFLSTCHHIPDREFIHVIWGLPVTKTTSHFRVYMKGIWQCRDVNTLWFMRRGIFGPA